MHRETSVTHSCAQVCVPCWGDLGSNQRQTSRGVEIVVRGHAPGLDVRCTPGSRASAKISLSEGQGGPFMHEEIDETGSADAVEAWQTSLKSAVAACSQVSITIFGVGSCT